MNYETRERHERNNWFRAVGVFRSDKIKRDELDQFIPQGTAAHNLRGIAVAVAAGATEFQVPFAAPEADARYALTVPPAWNSACAVVAKTTGAFTVRFAQPAPAGATLDWLLVR